MRRTHRTGHAAFVPLFTLLAVLSQSPEAFAASVAVIEVSGLRLAIDTSNGTAISLTQLPGNRELLAAGRNVPSFQLTLDHGKARPLILGSNHARKAEIHPIEDGCRITWSDFDAADLVIRASFVERPDGSGIACRLDVDNRTSHPITSIAFPILTCELPLTSGDPREAVVFPRHEGVLFRQPSKHFTRVGTWEREQYPGHASAQFMGYYDSGGGVYMAAHDPDGHPKDFRVRRGNAGLELMIVHLAEVPGKQSWSQPYPVVIDTFAGDWMDAADLYRDWSRRQTWCAKRIVERDVPAWLREGPAFYNYNATTTTRNKQPPAFFPPARAEKGLGQIGEKLSLPMVATPFGWEKHAVWIGPDYFPPNGGDHAYRQLIRSLREQDHRMFVFLSGFRWALSKPGSAYDGREAFDQGGEGMAVRDQAGEIVREERTWAENTLLCAGCKEARDLLADCFKQAYGLGITAVQLDQNVSGDVPVCYATDHDHPPGRGQWQSRSMAAFLSHVRREAKAGDPDRILTLEEPCELFIPQLDAYHGRAFTYDNWPARGKGAVSAPVFLYLYHPYLLGYAGWTGGGFDLENRVELSIGRAFIYGMLIGVRQQVGMQALHEDRPRATFDMWQRAVRVQRRCADALLLGDMARPPKLEGVKSEVLDKLKPRGQGPRPALTIDAVQATTWITPDNTTCYALANVEAESARIEIEIRPPGAKEAAAFDVIRVESEKTETIASNIRLGAWLPLSLGPYEVTCLRVRPIGSGASADRPATR